MISKTTAQDRANEAAFEDGYRCGFKSLGIKNRNKADLRLGLGVYDHEACDRLFKRGFRAFSRGIDREECFDEWVEGWHAGHEERFGATHERMAVQELYG
tara:strand:- start:663 stop:962 length:300 start_codon:yes stop_codon:yes gene_type:complete